MVSRRILGGLAGLVLSITPSNAEPLKLTKLTGSASSLLLKPSCEDFSQYKTTSELETQLKVLEAQYGTLDTDEKKCLAKGFEKLSDLAIKSEEYERAKEFAKNSLSLNLEAFGSRLNLSTISGYLNEFDQAYELAVEALPYTSTKEEQLKAYRNIVQFAYRTKRYNETKDYALKGLELAPEDVTLKKGLALANKKLGITSPSTD